MHPTVHAFVARVVREGRLASRRTLEVGSLDVNGSVRDLFTGEYTGLDARHGPGVDLVCNIEHPAPCAGEGWDVVVSTEMLEHTPHPWLAVWGMAAHLAPGGTLILTTRAPGFGIHDHPLDYYRFTPAAIAVLLDDAGIAACEIVDDPDPESPGVFAWGWRRA